jgi:hypothetical protein
MAMKLFTGWAVSAGLIVAASAANAQVPAPTDVGRAHYQAASDVQGPAPYAGVPSEAPATRYGPALLPPLEVYTVVRENGFSPLGLPHQRGYVYVIAVIDRAGEDGRLIIDARNGQIVRFVPAFRAGGYYGQDYPPPYGPAGRGPYGAPGLGRYGTEGRYGAQGSGPYGAAAPGQAGALPPTASVGGGPRPPASIPRVASRTVPVPAAKPTDLAGKPDSAVKPDLAGKPDLAAKPDLANKPAPQPKQQSVAVQAKPADVPAAPPAVIPAKPAPSIQPTEEMPKVQGLE